MKGFVIAFAICCLARTAKAHPGIGHEHLEGIPDLETFGGIKYPKYHLIDLGEYSKGHVPGDEIHETKHITVKEPQPYPVKIPVPQPYPVYVPKPYKVVETKIVEVPKPYPVHVHHDQHGHGDLHHAGSQNYGVNHESLGADQKHLSSLESEAQPEAAADYGGEATEDVKH